MQNSLHWIKIKHMLRKTQKRWNKTKEPNKMQETFLCLSDYRLKTSVPLWRALTSLYLLVSLFH